MVRRDALATGRRLGIIAVGLTVGLLSASSSYAQAPAAQAAPAANQRLFANDGAMVLNFIKPDKTADFELVISKLKEALAKSDKPERKQQAAGWKVYKSPDPAGANVLYVFVIDPALKGADYRGVEHHRGRLHGSGSDGHLDEIRRRLRAGHEHRQSERLLQARRVVFC